MRCKNTEANKKNISEEELLKKILTKGRFSKEFNKEVINHTYKKEERNNIKRGIGEH